MTTTQAAAIYARVSSEQQAQAHTIDSQVAALREKVSNDGLELAEEMEFIDEGYSGSTLVRPALAPPLQDWQFLRYTPLG